MYVKLDPYGNYKIYKSEKKMMREIEKEDLLIFDISSTLKGPLHTMVPFSHIGKLPGKIGFDLTMEADKKDLPFREQYSISSESEVDSYTTLYAITSQLYQLDAFGVYLDNYNVCEHEHLDISEIILNDIIVYLYEKDSDEVLRFHWFFNIPCSFLNRFLEMNHIHFSVNEEFNTDFLILKKDKTYFFDKINEMKKDYMYIGIPLYKAQSFYLFTIDQYQRLCNIRDLTVDVYEEWSTPEDELEKEIYKISDPYLGFDDDNEEDYNVMHADTSGKDILNLCETILYLPQYIEINMNIEKEDNEWLHYYIVLKMRYEELDIRVKITYEELVEIGFCLFKIIDKITRI